MSESDLEKLARRMNNIPYAIGHEAFRVDEAHKELVIPMTVRSAEPVEEVAHSVQLNEEQVRYDDQQKRDRIVAELVEQGIIKHTDSDRVTIRSIGTHKGGRVEEHMSWATVGGGFDDDGNLVIGGQHVSAKLVIPEAIIDKNRVKELHREQRLHQTRERFQTAMNNLGGISTEVILRELLARRGSELMAEAMVDVITNSFNLHHDFMYDWNVQAAAKHAGAGVDAQPPYLIVQEKPPEKPKTVQADGWAAARGEREDRKLT